MNTENKKPIPSITSEEFITWMRAAEKQNLDAASSFNDQDWYDIYIMNDEFQ